MKIIEDFHALDETDYKMLVEDYRTLITRLNGAKSRNERLVNRNKQLEEELSEKKALIDFLSSENGKIKRKLKRSLNK